MSNHINKTPPATQGRFFPFSISEARKIVHDNSFEHSEYRKGLEVIFLNPRKKDCKYGHYIACLYPKDAVALYSFPEEISITRAKLVTTFALQQLAEIDKTEITRFGRRFISRGHNEVTSFYAYLGRLNQLTITQWTYNAALKKYRAHERYSNIHPDIISSEEKVLYTGQL